MSAADAMVRFWRRVDTSGECWLWTGGTTTHGYGQMSVDFRKVLVHRFAYELFRGPIPDGLEIDHLCHVRNCVRWDHMEAVDHATNMARQRWKPECPKGHAMTGDNVLRRADTGHRICRACRDERNRAAYQRRKSLP